MASKPKAKPAGKSSKKNAKGEKKKSSGKTTLLMVVVTMTMVVVFKLGFLFFVLGILPSIVSYYIDATRSNLSFQTVFTCNLAGVLPFMADMLKDHGSNSAVQEIISNSVNWLIVYGAAGVGWLLVFIAPMLSQILINAMHQRQIGRLERHQRILVEEWGSELEAYLKVETTKAIEAPQKP